MSTRSIIGYVQKDGSFRGVYSHWDGYPSGVGQAIFNAALQHGIQAVTRHIVDDKVCGWSSLASWDCNLDHFVSFSDNDAITYEQRYVDNNDPYAGYAVYYDGSRADTTFYNRDSAKQSWAKFLYLFDETENTLSIFVYEYGVERLICTLPVIVSTSVIDWQALDWN